MFLWDERNESRERELIKIKIAINCELTVLCIEQNLVEMRLVVIKGLPDFVDRLLVGQVTIHEAARRSKTVSVNCEAEYQ